MAPQVSSVPLSIFTKLPIVESLPGLCCFTPFAESCDYRQPKGCRSFGSQHNSTQTSFCHRSAHACHHCSASFRYCSWPVLSPPPPSPSPPAPPILPPSSPHPPHSPPWPPYSPFPPLPPPSPPSPPLPPSLPKRWCEPICGGQDRRRAPHIQSRLPPNRTHFHPSQDSQQQRGHQSGTSARNRRATGASLEVACALLLLVVICAAVLRLMHSQRRLKTSYVADLEACPDDAVGVLPVTFELHGAIQEHGALTNVAAITSEVQLRSRIAELAFALLIDCDSELGGMQSMQLRYADNDGCLRLWEEGADVSAILSTTRDLRVSSCG